MHGIDWVTVFIVACVLVAIFGTIFGVVGFVALMLWRLVRHLQG